MKEEYQITPDDTHYNCVVDALTRAGRLEEAENFIKSMNAKPNTVTWMALLGGCRWNSDIERAERAVENIINLDYRSPRHMLY
jgi:pentatricopeptide repeat protein